MRWPPERSTAFGAIPANGSAGGSDASGPQGTAEPVVACLGGERQPCPGCDGTGTLTSTCIDLPCRRRVWTSVGEVLSSESGIGPASIEAAGARLIAALDHTQLRPLTRDIDDE